MSVVEIRGLEKSFGKVRAVNGLDLTIRKGEVFGLLGPNGCGKTTTIRILCGLTKPDRGECRILGSDLRKGNHLDQIGYMPQETALYEDLTVSENLRLFSGIYGLKKNEHKKIEEELLDLVDLLDRRDFTLANLSGGQRHRVSLVASMIHSPRFLFLDEPTVGVDPPLRAGFWKMFCRLKSEGKTILITTHYMDEARNCDRIGLMRAGRLIATGTPREIMRSTDTKNLEDAFLRLSGKGSDRMKHHSASGEVA